MVEVVRLTRREQQERTRLRILDAALGVFRKTGFAKATIDEIAELAGCTRGTVYLHFASKEGVMVAVLEHHLEAQLAGFGEQLDKARTEKALVALLVASATEETQDRRTGRVVDWAALIGGLRDSDDDLMQRLQVIQKLVDAQYARLFDKLCALRGIIPPVPTQRLALVALSLFDGLRVRAALDPRINVENELRSSLELLLTGSLR